MHIVLKAIEDYWTENTLSSIQRQDLVVLAEACKEPLQELKNIVGKAQKPRITMEAPY